MKRNLTVLVLLVAWSLMSTVSFPSAVLADEISQVHDADGGPPSDLIVDPNGDNDDDDDGDPGDAGDGFGAQSLPGLFGDGLGGSDGVGLAIPEGLWLFVASLIQLVL